MMSAREANCCNATNVYNFASPVWGQCMTAILGNLWPLSSNTEEKWPMDLRDQTRLHARTLATLLPPTNDNIQKNMRIYKTLKSQERHKRQDLVTHRVNNMTLSYCSFQKFSSFTKAVRRKGRDCLSKLVRFSVYLVRYQVLRKEANLPCVVISQ